MMSNRKVDVVSEGKEDLKAALSILFANAVGGTATHYQDVPEAGTRSDGTRRLRTLVFYWHEDKGAGALKLPVPLDLEGATELAWRWLGSLNPGERAGKIDMDGDCVPEGWRVFCEDWGHVLGSHYAFAGVQGMYAWYGK